MEQFTIQNLTVRVSEDFNYIWVLVDAETRSEQFAASLGNNLFLSLLMLRSVKKILLDCSKMLIFSIPDMSNFLDTSFAEKMRLSGVEKVSVIINEEIFSMMSGIFQAVESKHIQSPPQIRFFSTASFYESFDSVSWF
jgi:hypothetical protein